MDKLNKKWDLRFLKMAKLVSEWSKDPSTQTGAVLVRPDRTIISVGYNGFAPGVADLSDRYNDRSIKYEMVIHCEENALLDAGKDAVGSCLYTYPFQSCSRCTAKFIRAGVVRHVAPYPSEDVLSRWESNLKLSQEQMREANIDFILYHGYEI